MLLVKPDWVVHKDEKNKKASIFSITVHPDGSRIATGGLDSRVKIWNTAPILSERDQNNTKIDKLLCTLALHNGVVLCVRFSPSGRFLASGSDDQIIMIWELDNNPSNGFSRVFGSSDVNVENWKGTRRLAGHESDVADLAWSHDSAYLASCGLDSLVFVWDGTTFDRLVKIDRHTAFVKGVTWDPVGKYLATESDDGSVKIWNTDTWELEADITIPFENAPKNAFFRRLSWSPDGQSLTAANSMNGPVPVASVITRDLWDSDTSLVGHDLSIEVAAYNPHLFRPKAAAGSQNIASIVCIGSQDCGLSIWSTQRGTPIVVLKELFERSVLDIAWSADGMVLFACSADGTIIMVRLDPEELGNFVPDYVKDALLAKYGYTKPVRPYMPGNAVPSIAPVSPFGKSAQPNVLQSRRLTDIMNGGPVSTGCQTSVGITNGVIPPGPSKQKVTTLANGKRRIQPSFISNLSSAQSPIKPIISSTPSQPLQQQQLAPSLTISPQPAVNNAPPSSSFSTINGPNNPFASSVSNPFQPTENPFSQTMMQPTLQTPVMVQPLPYTMHTPNESPVGTKPWISAPFPEDAQKSPEKRKGPPEEDVDAPSKRRKPLLKAMPPIPLKVIRPARLPTFNKEVNGAPEIKPVLWLPVPSIKTTISATNQTGLTIEGRNSENGKPSTVEIKEKAGRIFLDYIQHPIISVTGTGHFFAVACEDASIILYTSAGRRFMPNLLLDSPVSFMQSTEHALMIITALGNLYVWDLFQGKAMFSPTSIAPLLGNYGGREKPLEIKSADVRANGVPMLCLSNGSSYIYDTNMKCWECVSEAWWAVGSDSWESRRSQGARGIVKQMESKTNEVYVELGRDTVQKDVLKCTVGGNEWETSVSIGHLETRLATAISLNSAAEYKQFLLAYVRKLSDESERSKAEELCKEFLGPIYCRATGDSKWIPTVLGMNKRELLKEFLPIFAKSRILQKIASDYQDLLKKVNADNDEWELP